MRFARGPFPRRRCSQRPSCCSPPSRPRAAPTRSRSPSPPRDYGFKLSAKTAPAGKVTFVVTNTGKADHSFQIAGKKTAAIKPGRTAKLVVTFTKAGPFAYTSTVAGDAARGMKGTFNDDARPRRAA